MNTPLCSVGFDLRTRRLQVFSLVLFSNTPSIKLDLIGMCRFAHLRISTDSRMGERGGAVVAQTSCEASPPSGELYEVNDEQNIRKRRCQSSSFLFMLLSRSCHLFERFDFIAFLLLHKTKTLV